MMIFKGDLYGCLTKSVISLCKFFLFILNSKFKGTKRHSVFLRTLNFRNILISKVDMTFFLRHSYSWYFHLYVQLSCIPMPWSCLTLINMTCVVCPLGTQWSEASWSGLLTVMAKPDFDGSENAELYIIWTISCFKMIISSYSCTQNDPQDHTVLMMYLKSVRA